MKLLHGGHSKSHFFTLLRLEIDQPLLLLSIFRFRDIGAHQFSRISTVTLEKRHELRSSGGKSSILCIDIHFHSKSNKGKESKQNILECVLK